MTSNVLATGKVIYGTGTEIGVSNAITSADLFINPVNTIARAPCMLICYLVLFANIANSVFVLQIPVS